jgi:UDP-glucose 4-epimerase
MLVHRKSAESKPNRVLVLGSRGFLASHLGRSLSASGIPFRAVGSSEIDLTRADSHSGLAALIHPGDAVVMTSILTPEKGRDHRTLLANIRMGETVVAALEFARCAHFVYISSDAVFDGRTLPISEQSSREATDAYSLAHTAREMLFASALGAFGVPLCVLRPCAVYGLGDTHNSYGPNRFVRSAVGEGEIVLFGAGEEMRCHIHVEDAVSLISRALLRESTGALNLAPGPAISFSDLANIVASACRRPVQIKETPRKTVVTHRVLDGSAIAKAFPDFSPTPIATGIRALVDSMCIPKTKGP